MQARGLVFATAGVAAVHADAQPRPRSGPDQGRRPIQRAQDLVAAYVWHFQQHALDAGLPIGGQLCRVGRRRKHGDG